MTGIEEGGWITIECERALYVDRGQATILCDRLPSPVTLVVKLRERHARNESGTKGDSV